MKGRCSSYNFDLSLASECIHFHQEPGRQGEEDGDNDGEMAENDGCCCGVDHVDMVGRVEVWLFNAVRRDSEAVLLYDILFCEWIFCVLGRVAYH
jgi:hypothetical protein